MIDGELALVDQGLQIEAERRQVLREIIGRLFERDELARLVFTRNGTPNSASPQQTIAR